MEYKLAIVGEAWGAEEEKAQAPFVGKSGLLLNQMLSEAGIKRDECFVTNCFNLRPQANDIKTLCGGKDTAIRGYPALFPGKYVSEKYTGELRRLTAELERVRPNLVLALGGTASWALLHGSGISKIRGCCALSPLGWKVLPTYHPAAILREYELRAITILDLHKARREMEFSHIYSPLRKIFVVETIDDLNLLRSRALNASWCSFDIETNSLEMTCIGFAFTEDEAWVVPFVDQRKPKFAFWSAPELEHIAHDTVRFVLAQPSIKVAQNGLYDLQWLAMKYGAFVNLTESHDTMLLHHALQPELEKGLGFLGSVYTNSPAWKTMRPRGKHSIKREE